VAAAKTDPVNTKLESTTMAQIREILIATPTIRPPPQTKLAGTENMVIGREPVSNSGPNNYGWFANVKSDVNG